MNKELLNVITHVLKMCKTDAQMAINGEWEPNDEGFEEQIKAIDHVLKHISVYKKNNKIN